MSSLPSPPSPLPNSSSSPTRTNTTYCVNGNELTLLRLPSTSPTLLATIQARRTNNSPTSPSLSTASTSSGGTTTNTLLHTAAIRALDLGPSLLDTPPSSCAASPPPSTALGRTIFRLPSPEPWAREAAQQGRLADLLVALGWQFAAPMPSPEASVVGELEVGEGKGEEKDGGVRLSVGDEASLIALREEEFEEEEREHVGGVRLPESYAASVAASDGCPSLSGGSSSSEASMDVRPPKPVLEAEEGLPLVRIRGNEDDEDEEEREQWIARLRRVSLLHFHDTAERGGSEDMERQQETDGGERTGEYGVEEQEDDGEGGSLRETDEAGYDGDSEGAFTDWRSDEGEEKDDIEQALARCAAEHMF